VIPNFARQLHGSLHAIRSRKPSEAPANQK
jgi:hypothetical protein